PLISIYYDIRIHQQPRTTLFPYTTLFRSDSETNEVMGVQFMDSDIIVEQAPFSMSKVSNKDKKLKRADQQDFQTHINKDLTLLEIVNEYRELKGITPLD